MTTPRKPTTAGCEHDRVTITRGRPAAVGFSIDDLASLEETLEITGRPPLITQIRVSLVEIAEGGATTLTKDEIVRTLRA